MSKSPQWILNTIEQHSEVFGNNSYNENYFNHIHQFANEIAKGKFSSIEYISTCNQSSFVTTCENESVIFFDVAQSLLIKNAFNKIGESDDFRLLADTLKRAGCLFSLHRDYNFSSLAFRHPIIEYENYYLVDEEKLNEYRYDLSAFKNILADPEFPHLIDYFIIGHELFHLLKRNGHLTNVDHSYSAGLFDFALTQCCYEDQPNFKEIATYYGELSLDNDALESIRRDLQTRRKHYLANQSFLEEEIQCDFFSFQCLLNSYFDRDLKSIDNHINFAATFFFIFSVFDLHFAMNRRFLHSESTGIDELKPGGIADMNFRKVALLEGMIIYVLKRCDFYEQKGEGLFFEAIYKYRQVLFEFKKAIDGLYLMPVTRAIRAILENTETLMDKTLSGAVAEYKIRSLLELIIQSEGMFNQTEVEKAFIYK